MNHMPRYSIQPRDIIYPFTKYMERDLERERLVNNNNPCKSCSPIWQEERKED